MSNVCRVNVDRVSGLEDSVPGLIIGELVGSVFVNNQPIAVVGADIEDHRIPGDEDKIPHQAEKMKDGSGTVFAGNIAVCRKGDAATCGDIAEDGSGNVYAG